MIEVRFLWNCIWVVSDTTKIILLVSASRSSGLCLKRCGFKCIGRLWQWLCAVRTDAHCNVFAFENSVITFYFCLLLYAYLPNSKEPLTHTPETSAIDSTPDSGTSFSCQLHEKNWRQFMVSKLIMSDDGNAALFIQLWLSLNLTQSRKVFCKQKIISNSILFITLLYSTISRQKLANQTKKLTKVNVNNVSALFLEFPSSWDKNSYDDITDPKLMKLLVP